MLTDIHGTHDTTLLDLTEFTGIPHSKFLGPGSISPDGRFILASYYHDWTTDGSRIDAHLLLLDMADLSARDVPIEHEDFESSWGDMHWLDNKTFLVPVDTYRPDEIVRCLQKDVDDLTAQRVIAFPTHRPTRVWDAHTSSLLYASELEPTASRIVWALDRTGARMATPSESSYFLQMEPHGYWDHDPDAPVEVRLDRVIDAVEGWGKYWEENWNRYWIYLDGKKVRCSDGNVERKPVWDSDLNLFIWYEIGTPYQVLYMDLGGHYRTWHTDWYLGRIPKQGRGEVAGESHRNEQ